MAKRNHGTRVSSLDEYIEWECYEDEVKCRKASKKAKLAAQEANADAQKANAAMKRAMARKQTTKSIDTDLTAMNQLLDRWEALQSTDPNKPQTARQKLEANYIASQLSELYGVDVSDLK